MLMPSFKQQSTSPHISFSSLFQYPSAVAAPLPTNVPLPSVSQVTDLIARYESALAAAAQQVLVDFSNARDRPSPHPAVASTYLGSLSDA
jgi:hypothetical protein